MTRTPLALLAALTLAALAPAPAAAQGRGQSSPPPAQSARPSAADEREVVQAVQRFFDAMRARDTAALRAVTDSGTKLISTGVGRDGAPELETTTIGEFVRIVATAAPGKKLDERIYAPEVRIDGLLATVWTKYDFYVDQQLSHCGVDSFHLFHSAAGWKVIHIADTRQTAGCPLGR